MSNKFEWEEGDLELVGAPDPNREILEEAHGRLFPDADTVKIPSATLALQILEARNVTIIGDPVQQALTLLKQ